MGRGQQYTDRPFCQAAEDTALSHSGPRGRVLLIDKEADGLNTQQFEGATSGTGIPRPPSLRTRRIPQRALSGLQQFPSGCTAHGRVPFGARELRDVRTASVRYSAKKKTTFRATWGVRVPSRP